MRTTLMLSQDNISVDELNTIFIKDEAIDNSIQSRAGHYNGNIDAGERITFQVALKANYGDFISTSANIFTNNNNIKVLTPKLSFEDIKQGSSIVSNSPLIIEISERAQHQDKIILNFEIIDSQKRNSDGSYKIFRDRITFIVNKVGPIQFSRAIIDDDNIGQSKGDGDGIIEKADKDIEIPLLLKNLGEPDIKNVIVKLSSNISNVRLLEDTHTYDIVKGSSTSNSTPADYVFYIDDRGPSSINFIPMKLNIKGTYNNYVYNWEHSFKLGNSFGYLDLSNIDRSIEIKVNGYVPTNSKLKFLSETKVKLSFNKSGFETLNRVVTIAENKIIFVKTTLKENPKPTSGYISLKEEQNKIKLTKPEDYSLRKSYQQFYKSPRFKREKKRPLNWGGFMVGALVGVIGEFLYIEGVGEVGDKNEKLKFKGRMAAVFASPLAIIGLFSNRKYKPINKNINYNKHKKLKAINKANEISEIDYKNQLVQNSFVSKKRNEQIKLENIEIENKNKIIRKENEIIKNKNDSLRVLNNEIIKINNSKKAIFSYKIGEGNWIELN